MTAGQHERTLSFRLFWAAQVAAQLGTQVIKLALPTIAVVSLSAGETEVGYLSAAGVAAFLVIGLPAGAWVERRPKRRVLVAAVVARSSILAVIPALHLFGNLELWTLYLVAFGLGVTNVIFDVAGQSYLPSLVEGDRIADANGKLEATQQLAALGGPVLAGAFLGAISPPLVASAAVAIFAFSALLLVRLNDRERPRSTAQGQGNLRRNVLDGLRWVFGQRLLRRVIMTSALMNLATGMVFTLMPVYLLRHLGYSSERMGILLALGAVGGLSGALLMPRLTRRVGEGRLIPLSALGVGVTLVLVPVALVGPTFWALPVLVVQGFLTSLFGVVYNTTQVTFRQRVTPRELLGRMNASVRFIVYGVMPVAALLAGWLGRELGLIWTVRIGAGIGLCAFLPVMLSSLRSSRAITQRPATEG